ncbi:DUF4253 domain-containing protein [Streptomyces sp. NPDC058001]|uniref:DUF4253 domain-containing protein n=1 Tax=Streptomyces sp. NPDC058001 TaxID=3346300 RepID=UPI0036E9EF0A
MSVSVSVRELIRRVALEYGVVNSWVETRVSPSGAALWGVMCPEPSQQRALWTAFRALHGESGLFPFVSHEGPAAWEWEELGETERAARTRGAGVGRGIADLVNSQGSALTFSQEAEDSLKGENPPHPPPPSWRSNFSSQPEWVCLAEAEDQFQLPLLLDSPFTPNWIDDAGGSLTYEDHATVLREWNDRHGVDIYYLGSNALRLRVSNPPHTPEARMRTAREQYAYCYDLEQVTGMGTVAGVARAQAGAEFWYFWWD